MKVTIASYAANTEQYLNCSRSLYQVVSRIDHVLQHTATSCRNTLASLKCVPPYIKATFGIIWSLMSSLLPKIACILQKLGLFEKSCQLPEIILGIWAGEIRCYRNRRAAIQKPAWLQHIIAITNGLSNLAQVVALSHIRSADVTHTFLELWGYKHWATKTLLSDNGKQVTSKFFQNVAQLHKNSRRLVFSYNPQTNEQVRRYK